MLTYSFSSLRWPSKVCRLPNDSPRVSPRHHPAATLASVVLLTAFGAASVAEAKVQVKVKADGTKVVYDPSESYYVRHTSGSLRPVPGAGLADLIDHYARDRGLSPQLVQAVIQVESAYNPRARSRKGAMGLMQLMPDTARSLRVTDPYDPGQNIRGGTLYLRRQLDRFSGDVSLALAAYNAGPGAVTQYGGIPPYRETRNYVRKVLSLYRGSAPTSFQQPARPVVKPTQQASAPTAATPIAKPQPRGADVFMSRGGNNRIRFTTKRPKSN